MRQADRVGGPPVVLVGLDTVVGLQTARVLRSHGISVIAIAADRKHYCATTRAVDEVIEAPTAGDGLVDALARLADRVPEGSPLLPCRDPSVRTISRHRESLGHYAIRLPDDVILSRLVDKSSFAAMATDAGLRVPRGITLETGADVASAVADLRFPLFVKPVERDDRWQDSGQDKAYEVSDLAELSAVLGVACRHADRFVIQEKIPGPVASHVTCNAVFGRTGQALGSFTSEKIRQWPETSGSGSAGRAAIDPELRELTTAFFRDLDMRGLAYLEAKRDERDGELVLIEANIGRPTGRGSLADRIGVPLLRAWYDDAVGLDVAPLAHQPESTATWVFLRADLQAGFRQWRRGDLRPRDWLETYRSAVVDAVVDLRDPRPALTDLRRVGRKVGTRDGT